MDLAFSQEQEMLRESARSVLADRSSPERVAELAESDEGWDRELWSQIAELGWIGLSVPEDVGGSGMSFLDEAVLFEELGRALYPGPYLSTVALAQPALQRNRGALADLMARAGTATLAWAEPSGVTSLEDVDATKTEARPNGGGWRIEGSKTLVPDAAAADGFVVTARVPDGIGLLWVLAGGCRVSQRTSLDPTRRIGEVDIDATDAVMLAEGDDASATIRAIRLRALAALSLEAVGVAQKVLELAVAYTSERKQFGKPIAAYQAVSHQVADIYVDVELARSLAYWAAWCVAEDDDHAPVAAAAAKSSASDAAADACERSIQVHGGIGFTYEHILHRYYKRAQAIQAFEGYGRAHRADVARRLLD